MGLEFLFEPITIFVFIALNIVLVLIQRHLFRQSFEILGTKGVMTGYVFILILSLLIGCWDSGGTFRGFAINSLLTSYLSLIVVSVVLMPSSLWLASRQKASVGTIVLVGIALWTFMVFYSVLNAGLDRVIERGTGWLTMQASELAFLVAVSAVFAMGLKRR